MNKLVNIPEYEVSQFNQHIKDLIETNYNYVRIRGEIFELKNASSGHVYITLKDQHSVLNATLWNQKKNYISINPEIGMEVIVTGKISTYAKSISTYSINIDQIELAGQGSLLKLIQDRKQKLKNSGVFDDKHKKNIPYLPNKIGVITSSTGSVIHDIINRIKDRFPTNVDIWPVPVQGINAAKNIIVAIENFNSNKYISKPDVIIIARGGGSTEDLMPFNDEKLVLAIFDSKIPIISAIGHETDTTLIDYVSDLRASTPTAAAEKSLPKKTDLKQLVLNFSGRIDTLLFNKLIQKKSDVYNISKFLKAPNFIVNLYKDKFIKIDFTLKRILEIFYKNNINNFNRVLKSFHTPEYIIHDKKNFLEKLSINLEKNIKIKNENENKEFLKLKRLLESNSLHTNLKKGYSIIRKSKKIINNSNLINKNDLVNIQFLDKSIDISIKKIN